MKVIDKAPSLPKHLFIPFLFNHPSWFRRASCFYAYSMVWTVSVNIWAPQILVDSSWINDSQNGKPLSVGSILPAAVRMKTQLGLLLLTTPDNHGVCMAKLLREAETSLPSRLYSNLWFLTSEHLLPRAGEGKQQLRAECEAHSREF